MADLLIISPLSERIKELWVECGLHVYCEQWSCAIGGSMITWKTRIN